MIRSYHCLLFLGLALSVQSQALFNVPDSLQIPDSVAVLDLLDYSYKQVDDSIDVLSKTEYRLQQHEYWEDLNLGNNGSESMPTVIPWDNTPGFRVGYNGLNAFRWDWDDVQFYRTNIAITELGVSLGTSFANSSSSLQDNTQTDAFFTRDFANRVNTSLRYRSISELGMYQRDQSKHIQVAWQLNQWNEKGNFFYHLGWIRNALNRQSNGGIESLELLNDDLYLIRENMPISFSDAGKRDASNQFRLGWAYWLSGKSKRGLFIENQTTTNYRYYKFFSNETPELDSIFSNVPGDFEGLRNSFTLRQYANDLSINWSSPLFKSIQAGFKYEYNDLDEGLSSSGLHFGTLYGKVLFDLNSKFQFDIDAYLETLEESGDFDISGDFSFDANKWGAIQAYASIGRQSPERHMEYLEVTNAIIYRRNLPTTNYFHFGGKLEWPSLGLRVGLRQLLLDQYSFFDLNYDVQVSDILLSVTSLDVRWKFDWRGFSMENSFMFESFDTQVFFSPLWQSKHHLVYSRKLGRGGNTFRLGAEGRVLELSQQARFVPFNSTFIPTQQNGPTSFIYSVAPYFQADIQTFSIYFKAENLQSVWWEQHFVPVLDRPMFDWMLRVGINWRLRN